MNNKFTLSLIILIGIGIFALPSTMSLFAGQHSFYNIDATGNQIPCVKCHGDIKVELTQTGVDTPHDEFKCEMCHRIEAGKSSGDSILYSRQYTDGVYNRTLVMSETDYEANRFPDTIPANGTPTITDVLAYAISPGYSGVEATLSPVLSHGSPSKPSMIQLLNPDGTPKDTDPLTRYAGVRLSKVTSIQWDMSTAYPRLKLDGLGSEIVNPGTAYHAASLVSCMECHGGEAPRGHEQGDLAVCSNCHYGSSNNAMRNLQAGGFGMTSLTGDTGSKEAHNEFVRANDTMSRYEYGVSNGACVACHTHMAVDINFKKSYLLKFDATRFEDGTWSVGGFSAKGVTHKEVYGNQEGNVYAVGNTSMDWTPDSNLYTNTGVKIVGLSGDSGDNSTALTS